MEYKKRYTMGTIDYIEYKKKIELQLNNIKKLMNIVRKKYLWFSSCWDEQAIEDIASVNALCFKVASASLTDADTINKMLSYDVPMIMSTGMSSMEEIEKA